MPGCPSINCPDSQDLRRAIWPDPVQGLVAILADYTAKSTNEARPAQRDDMRFKDEQEPTATKQPSAIVLQTAQDLAAILDEVE